MFSRKQLLFLILFLFFTSFTTDLFSALVLPDSPPQVAIDWSGIDEEDGNGSEAFSTRGERFSVYLRVLCNVEQGYNITFHSANAKRKNSSRLTKGSDRIDYTAKLITRRIKNANVVKSSLELKKSRPSVEVNFFRGKLPLDGGKNQANVIELELKLSKYGGTIKFKPMGIYTDIITATAALN